MFNGSGSGFDGGNIPQFGRNVFRGVGREIKGQKGSQGGGKAGFSLRPVDKDSHGFANATPGVDEVKGFLDPAPAGDDILDKEEGFPGCDLEIPAQGEPVIDLLGKDEAFSELAGHFLSDDEAAHGWGNDGPDLAHIGETGDEELGEPGDLSRILANAGTLEEVAGPEAGAKDEMPFEKGAGLFEDLQDFSFVGNHGEEEFPDSIFNST